MPKRYCPKYNITINPVYISQFWFDSGFVLWWTCHFIIHKHKLYAIREAKNYLLNKNNIKKKTISSDPSKINKYLEYDTDENYTLNKITIEDNVIIGSGCVIIGECNILEGATVGALSFVKGNLNSWSIYAGNPAKFIKTRKK